MRTQGTFYLRDQDMSYKILININKAIFIKLSHHQSLIFDKVMLAQLQKWLEIMDQRLSPTTTLTPADHAGLIDRLLTGIKSYYVRTKRGGAIQPATGDTYLVDLVKDLYESMPEKLKNTPSHNLTELNAYLNSEHGFQRGFVAAIPRWNTLMNNARHAVAPRAPTYQNDLFISFTNNAGRARLAAFDAVREDLRNLVSEFEASPETSRQNFPAFTRALAPYQFAIHALTLADMLKGTTPTAPMKLESAIKKFLNEPLHKEYLKQNPAIVAFLTKESPAIISKPIGQIVQAYAAQVMLPRNNKESDYSLILAKALRVDVKSEYKGNSSHAIDRNPESTWLSHVQDYRWALAADEIMQAMRKYEVYARAQMAQSGQASGSTHLDRISRQQEQIALPGF